MKYSIPISDDIARDVYNLHTFDMDWGGDVRTLDRVIRYMQIQCIGRALSVCNDVVTDQEALKSFDRGYVKGLHEAMTLLKNASMAGRRLQFPTEGHEKPPVIV